MDTMTWVLILDKAVCISFGTNTLEKCMNPTIFLPSMGKYQSILGSFTLMWQPVKEKENFKLKSVKLR